MIGKRVVIAGAGAGGLIAAGRAAELGADVTILEKMERPGKKLRISGNSRCNLSNKRSLEDFIPMYGENGKFLYSAFHHFFRDELVKLLEQYGVNVATEADGRIFPASGKASDVADALERFAFDSGARLHTNERVIDILAENKKIKGVQSIHRVYPADAVILASGGASYPQTGSTGDGYRLAKSLGHTIVRTRPALSSLILEEEELVKRIQGISLQGVKLTALACEVDSIDVGLIPVHDTGRGLPGRKPHPPVIESRTGDIIFTRFGISGPAALLMSLAITDALEKGPVALCIDLLPSVSRRQLADKLQHAFNSHGGRMLHNNLSSFIAARLADAILAISSIDANKKAGQVSMAERELLSDLMKNFAFGVRGPRPLSEALVTAGGICLDEIDPRSMESKLIDGLFFCGEVIDIDADTGGYNLQAAFSTGHLAGQCSGGAR